jgi:hypothetical protein
VAEDKVLVTEPIRFLFPCRSRFGELVRATSCRALQGNPLASRLDQPAKVSGGGTSVPGLCALQQLFLPFAGLVRDESGGGASQVGPRPATCTTQSPTARSVTHPAAGNWWQAVGMETGGSCLESDAWQGGWQWRLRGLCVKLRVSRTGRERACRQPRSRSRVLKLSRYPLKLNFGPLLLSSSPTNSNPNKHKRINLSHQPTKQIHHHG